MFAWGLAYCQYQPYQQQSLTVEFVHVCAVMIITIRVDICTLGLLAGKTAQIDDMSAKPIRLYCPVCMTDMGTGQKQHVHILCTDNSGESGV